MNHAENRNIVGCLGVAALAIAASAPVSKAQYTVEVVGTGFFSPTYVTQAPGETDRLFIAEHKVSSGGGLVGRVSALDLETGARSTFLEVPGVSTSGDGGLLGLAFHPDFNSTGEVGEGKFYVSYVTEATEFDSPGTRGSRLDEYRVVNSVPTFQRMLLEQRSFRPSKPIHSIGHLTFGPAVLGDERNLYVGMGDHGPHAFDVGFENHSQDPGHRAGKILRIDVDGPDSQPANPLVNYAIPDGNPFKNDGDPNTDDAVWHQGFRNPWRFSFDRQTGEMYIGDVGLHTREEFSYAAAGESNVDFGWAQREGGIAIPNASYPGFTGLKGDSRDPFIDASHIGDGFNSATGGYVYRGPIPELQGKYLFADFTSSRVFAYDTDLFDKGTYLNDNDNFSIHGIGDAEVEDLTPKVLNDLGLGSFGGNRLPSFGEDNEGNLYLVDYNFGGPGSIYRFTLVDFVLIVDPASGAAQLRNTSGASLDIDGYTISSSSGSLLASDGSWSSLEDKKLDGAAWQESNSGATRLSETRPDSATTLDRNTGIDLGTLFDANGGSQDVVLQYLVAGESAARTGAVVYETITTTPGDFDLDGDVDGDDLTRSVLGWEQRFGNDLDVADILGWQRSFVALGAGSPSGVTVPEPDACGLAGATLLGIATKRSRRAFFFGSDERRI